MGLDMFAFTTEEEIPAVDFSEDIASDEIFRWRKHPNLHGWMERLYEAKGGTADSFNCVPVRLDAADIASPISRPRLRRDLVLLIVVRLDAPGAAEIADVTHTQLPELRCCRRISPE